MYVCNYRREACPAGWHTFGRGRVFYAQLTPDTDIVEHLGRVQPKADGRWDWWVGAGSWCFPRPGGPHPAQGVAATRAAAERVVGEYWSASPEAACATSSSASGPA